VLLGFRSNKLWKKILSVMYLVLVGLAAIGLIFDSRQGQITVYDFMIDKLYSGVLLLWMLSPYIFLSNTKYRDKLPLFKKHSIGASMVGLAIVGSIILTLSGVVNGLHSKEYKADMENHAYIEVSSVAATCEADGKIEKHCEYCGKDTIETIKALGHTMKQVSADEEKIVNRCDICGEEKVEVIETEPITETVLKEETQKKEPSESTPSTKVAVETEPSHETSKEDTMIQQFIALGFTETEASKIQEIFTTVGITKISNIQFAIGDGIDKLQSFKCNIFDYKTSLSLHFTVEKRQLCFISLNGIPTTKVDYAYINIFGNVKFKTSSGKKSVTLYDIGDENGEIIPDAVGYKAVFDYDNKEIKAYE